MRKIKQDELYNSLNDFLKIKGIELKEGAYAQRIQSACNLLGETINATQNTAKRAVNEVDRKLDQVRQCIHEATAPKPPKQAGSKAAKAGSSKIKKPKKSSDGSRGPKRTDA